MAGLNETLRYSVAKRALGMNLLLYLRVTNAQYLADASSYSQSIENLEALAARQDAHLPHRTSTYSEPLKTYRGWRQKAKRLRYFEVNMQDKITMTKYVRAEFDYRREHQEQQLEYKSTT